MFLRLNPIQLQIAKSSEVNTYTDNWNTRTITFELVGVRNVGETDYATTLEAIRRYISFGENRRDVVTLYRYKAIGESISVTPIGTFDISGTKITVTSIETYEEGSNVVYYAIASNQFKQISYKSNLIAYNFLDLSNQEDATLKVPNTLRGLIGNLSSDRLSLSQLSRKPLNVKVELLTRLSRDNMAYFAKNPLTSLVLPKGFKGARITDLTTNQSTYIAPKDLVVSSDSYRAARIDSTPLNKATVTTSIRDEKVNFNIETKSAQVVELYRTIDNVSRKIGSAIVKDGKANIVTSQLMPANGVSYEVRGILANGIVKDSVHIEPIVATSALKNGGYVNKTTSGVDQSAKTSAQSFIQDVVLSDAKLTTYNQHQIYATFVTSGIPSDSLEYVQVLRDNNVIATIAPTNLSDNAILLEQIAGDSVKALNYDIVVVDKFRNETKLARSIQLDIVAMPTLSNRLMTKRRIV